MYDLLRIFANFARNPLALRQDLRELREEIHECYDANKIVPVTMIGIALDPVEQPQGIIDRIVRDRLQNVVSDIADGIEDGKIEILKIHARYLSAEKHEEILEAADQAAKHPESSQAVLDLAQVFHQQITDKTTEIPCIYLGDVMNVLQKARPCEIDLEHLSWKAIALGNDSQRTLEFWWRLNVIEPWNQMFDKPEKPKFPPLPRDPQNTQRERVRKPAPVWKPVTKSI